jgi:hypothetical protein
MEKIFSMVRGQGLLLKLPRGLNPQLEAKGYEYVCQHVMERLMEQKTNELDWVSLRGDGKECWAVVCGRRECLGSETYDMRDKDLYQSKVYPIK